jgi:dTDP-glucose 4,6-dehydratase
MARYLVTGGAGFIGSHTVDALVAQGHQVRVIDDLSSGNKANLAQVADKIEFTQGDIRDRALINRLMAGVERVIHLAALRSVPKSMHDPYGYTDVNVLATVGLLEAAVNAGTKRFVCISSSSVYGDIQEMPLREDMLTAPISPYAASKLADEVFCQMFTRAFSVEAVGIRYFNVFGARQSLENQYAVVVPKFITCCLKGEQPPIYGDGLQSRDFTYVDNVVAGTIRASEAPGIGGEVFNIALGEEHTVLDLLNEINKILGTNIKPQFVEPRPGDVRRTYADSSKAKRLMGWQGHVSFSEGLRRTAEWFKRNPVREI